MIQAQRAAGEVAAGSPSAACAVPAPGVADDALAPAPAPPFAAASTHPAPQKGAVAVGSAPHARARQAPQQENCWTAVAGIHRCPPARQQPPEPPPGPVCTSNVDGKHQSMHPHTHTWAYTSGDESRTPAPRFHISILFFVGGCGCCAVAQRWQQLAYLGRRRQHPRQVMRWAARIVHIIFLSCTV